MSCGRVCSGIREDRTITDSEGGPSDGHIAPPNYVCFKNDGATDDFHYYVVNSTDSAGNVVYQGYDHVVGTGDYALTGTFNPISRTFSFNTNQPPFVWVNQWSADANGNWQSGFLYAIVADPTVMADPIGYGTIPSTFSKC